MGVGHLAVGFAAKRIAPGVPLALLLVAATLLDILWSTFILLGLEHARIVPGITAAAPLELYDYPISHSLVGTGLWMLVAGGIFFLVARDRRAAMVVALCVLSHWVLDVVSHRADVPVGWRGPYLGLGLWNSVPATIAVEESMLVLGIVVYMRVSIARSPAGTWGLGALALLLCVLGAGAYLGRPPPDITTLAAGNLAGSLLVLAAHAVDRRRMPVIAG